MSNNPTVLYFGIYEPSYARNWVLINGLRKNGVRVIELRQNPSRFALFRLFFDYLRYREKFDLMIVGFPGQEVMFLARLLAPRKKIIFDAFTSHYGGYILDRRHWGNKSIRAYYFRWLDKWSCRLADIVLLDTRAHINFFVREFNLKEEKLRHIWIGANDDNFIPLDNMHREGSGFNVLFFGTYVPLQGVEYIIKAAKLLEAHPDIVFTFYGKGQDKPKCLKLAEELGLKNVRFEAMIKPEDLRLKIASSDIVLGLFGDTPKTPLVIPNKVYEALAMAKPVITADTPAIRELFSPNELFLIKPANPEMLAKAIILLKNDPELRQTLSKNGYISFRNNASSHVLGSRLKLIIEECLKK